MKTQHKVILSLGTNQGNRLENIKRCLHLIHQQIGTVIKVSALYECPSWGFESDAFYNCALVLHTHSDAFTVLDKALAIEKQLGRIRNASEGYQSRIIDIDLIAFDEQIIDSEKLKVPHPLLHNRNFVLLPMNNLELDWVHPILNQNIASLLQTTSDVSQCTIIQKLENPLQSFTPKKAAYIAIEGNIGAGKSTLVNRISEDLNLKTVLERFSDNPFLPKFYLDQRRYAFPLEMSFLADRHQQLTTDFGSLTAVSELILSDYYIFKSLIFAKITLDEAEFQLYKSWFDIVCQSIKKPDLYVFLYQNPQRLLENIRARGRSYEQNIADSYLERINRGYLEYISSQKDLNVLIIDISEKDFVKNQEEYLAILEQIQNRMLSL